uniref:Uncharacterized protein n=1 Tax=Arundo donax TaxID=35708 RepID=A0A0A9HRG1_ARUDO
MLLLLLFLDSTFLYIQRFPLQPQLPSNNVLVFRHLAATRRPKKKVSPSKQNSI